MAALENVDLVTMNHSSSPEVVDLACLPLACALDSHFARLTRLRRQMLDVAVATLHPITSVVGSPCLAGPSGSQRDGALSSSPSSSSASSNFLLHRRDSASLFSNPRHAAFGSREGRGCRRCCSWCSSPAAVALTVAERDARAAHCRDEATQRGLLELQYCASLDIGHFHHLSAALCADVCRLEMSHAQAFEQLELAHAALAGQDAQRRQREAELLLVIHSLEVRLREAVGSDNSTSSCRIDACGSTWAAETVRLAEREGRLVIREDEAEQWSHIVETRSSIVAEQHVFRDQALGVAASELAEAAALVAHHGVRSAGHEAAAEVVDCHLGAAALVAPRSVPSAATSFPLQLSMCCGIEEAERLRIATTEATGRYTLLDANSMRKQPHFTSRRP